MILGLNITHNSAVSLIDQQGRVIYASQEERFTRRKNEVGFPTLALKYVLDHLCKPENITHVVVGESCSSVFFSRKFGQFFYLDNLNSKDLIIGSKISCLHLGFKEIWGRIWRKTPIRLSEMVRYKLFNLGINAPVQFFDHHLSHASSAYFSSPFDSALIFTMDAEGDQCSGSFFKAEKGTLSCIERFPKEDSVGVFYKSIVSLLGFEPNSHEGKILGLAAYGNPLTYEPEIKKILYVSDKNKVLTIESTMAQTINNGLRISETSIFQLIKTFGLYFFSKKFSSWNDLKRNILKNFYTRNFFEKTNIKAKDLEKFDFRADLSAAAQKVFEDVVVEFIRNKIKDSPTSHLCLAGGLFANVKLNKKLVESFPHISFYVCPAMGDEGLSLGAAQLKWSQIFKQKPFPLIDLSLGYSDNDENAFKTNSTLNLENLSYYLANQLSQGKIIGFYNGSAEFGPRALGHRSLLADPRSASTAQQLNQRLKRNDFMPFAPVISEENFDLVFNLKGKKENRDYLGRYMTTLVDVKVDWSDRLEATTHVDKTSRPQIISKNSKSLYNKILEDFYKITKVPVLLNTSMNIHEEPIVNSLADAIRLLEKDVIDLLVINETFLLDNHPKPANQDLFLKNNSKPVQEYLQ